MVTLNAQSYITFFAYCLNFTGAGRILTASLFFNMCRPMRMTSQASAVIHKFLVFQKPVVGALVILSACKYDCTTDLTK